MINAHVLMTFYHFEIVSLTVWLFVIVDRIINIMDKDRDIHMPFHQQTVLNGLPTKRFIHIIGKLVYATKSHANFRAVPSLFYITQRDYEKVVLPANYDIISCCLQSVIYTTYL